MAFGEVGQAEFIRDNTGAITGIRMGARTWSPGSVASGGVVEAANLAAFPGTGDVNFLYAALDTKKLYLWTGSAYVEASGLPANTDVVPEGSTNLYSTAARILGQVLTAIDVTTRGAVDATKTVLQAIGLLEASKQDKLKNQTSVSGATYTVLDSDAGKELVISAVNCTITIPAGLSAKFRCDWSTTSAATGTIAFQGDGTSTVLSTNNVFTASGPKCAGQIAYTGTTNQYLLSGQLGQILPADIYAAALTLLSTAPGANITVSGDGTNIAISSTGGGGGAPPYDLCNFYCSVDYGGKSTLTTVGANGFALNGGTVSPQSGTWNGTNLSQRLRLPTAGATANTSAIINNSQPVGIVPGTSPSDGVIRISSVWAAGDATSGCRIASGWYNAQTPSASSEPSALLNKAIVGADSGDTNLKVMTADGSTNSSIDLGASYPKDGGPYSTWLKLTPAATRSLAYMVYNRATNVLTSGTKTTNLPVAGQPVHPFVYRNSAANTSVVNIDFGGMWGGIFSGAP